MTRLKRRVFNQEGWINADTSTNEHSLCKYYYMQQFNFFAYFDQIE